MKLLGLLFILSAFTSRYACCETVSQEQLEAVLATVPQVTLAGTCDSKVSSVFVPEAQARALLPAGLELAPQPYFPQGMHPLQLMFQISQDLHLVGVDLPHFAPYKEVILAVQSVRLKGGSGKVYTYYSKLYLDSFLPVILGYYLGFPKHLGNFEFGADKYVAETAFGTPVAALAFRRKLNFNEAQFAQNFAMLKATGTTQDIVASGYGQLVCSRFTFDLDHVVTYPIESTWELSTGLQNAVMGHYPVPSFDQSPFGSFALKASWQLRGPLPCE